MAALLIKSAKGSTKVELDLTTSLGRDLADLVFQALSSWKALPIEDHVRLLDARRDLNLGREVYFSYEERVEECSIGAGPQNGDLPL